MNRGEKETPAFGGNLEARAVTRFVRISPRKARLVLAAIRRRHVGEALSILALMRKRAARIVAKTLHSAAANAKIKKMDEERLIVKAAYADDGPRLKRYLPRAMGRADEIKKRMAHITLIVAEGAKRVKQIDRRDDQKKAPKRHDAPLKTKRQKAAAGAA
jgi:large subunit ribosomal protein L22